MAIQNDNTLVTKGDLKELYTDKIAPYLGGGINYYHTDRTGEELKSSSFKLFQSGKADTPDSNDYGEITVAKGGIIPFKKITGNFEEGSTQGSFKVPNGMRIEATLNLTICKGTSSTNNYINVRSWLYNITDSVYCKGDNNESMPCAYSYTGESGIANFSNSGYAMSRGGVYQWTNNTGHTVELGFKIGNFDNSQSGMPASIRTDSSTMTVKEIGRIVDPVKYVSNNSDLQETPVGNIISYMGNSVPKHYLACDSTTYSIGTYPELEAFIIDEFGSINYFGGDGSTTWAVPDLRGEFLRGTGTNSHANQGNGANVGIHQDATEMPYIQGSSGNLGGRAKDSNTTHEVVAEYKNVDSEFGAPGNLKYASGFTNNVSNLPPDFTSRPTNTSVKYCIKYESTFHAFFSNAAYKVEATYAASTSGGITLTYSQGDSSLINNGKFVVPIDGWYSLTAVPTTDISADIQYLLNIDGIEKGRTYGSSAWTEYFTKGQVVQIRISGINFVSHNGTASFCLLTSNYNPTIVSADSVYSENEQMVGYWKDGKPLYQKTLVFNNVTITATQQNLGDLSSLNIDYGTIVDVNGYENGERYFLNSSFVRCWLRVPLNNIGFISTDGSRTFAPLYITIQYTKTTDTASSLQVENSLLLNRPDLWTAGTEYHFGGGLYGIRKTGTIPSLTAGTRNDIVIKTDNSITKVISSGGSSTYSTWDYVIPYTQAGQREQFIWFNKGSSSVTSNSIVFYTRNLSNATCEASTYDVWVLYKK